ncbi:MAG TPA: magnesium transporter CorA family protein [Candidatus Paceibacterota bacterium]|nr:magnesium transporter CorA family protein [Candidatus Paceibacterota bacterium]
MITRYPYRELVWIDIEKPTHEEVRALMDEFDIHPMVADELLGPSVRPKVDRHENFIYLVLHFPAIRHSHGSSQAQEIDFIIGKKFLITVRYDAVDPLHKFSKVFEVNSILDRSNIGEHAGFLFFYMIRKIYASCIHELEIIRDQLGDAEEQIFAGRERDMVEQLSVINRDLLTFHRALRQHEATLNSLARASEEFFGNEFRHWIENVVGEYLKVEEMFEDQKEVLANLRETNNSLLSTKTNDVMKVLTATTFSILPASLLGQIFSTRAGGMPLIDSPYAFWIILTGMIILAGSTYFYFKRKRWL